jgi:hypothetical protein
MFNKDKLRQQEEKLLEKLYLEECPIEQDKILDIIHHVRDEIDSLDTRRGNV